MKICPKCKNEYRDGITHCADCGCELIEENTANADQKAVVVAPYPAAQKVKEYLDYCGFQGIIISEPTPEGLTTVFCDGKDYKKVIQEAQVFMNEEMKRSMAAQMEQMSEEELDAQRKAAMAQVPPSNIYQNYESKANENKSSAISFFVVGALGIVVVALSWFELLPFSIGGSRNWFTHGVLLALFILFIVIGIISAKNINKYKELAGKEADSKSELEKYLEKEFTKEFLLNITAATEEEAYFRRMTYMRNKVQQDFTEKNYNSTFIESLLDQHYDSIFG